MWALLKFTKPEVTLPAFLPPGNLFDALTRAIHVLTKREFLPELAIIESVTLTKPSPGSGLKVGECDAKTEVRGEALLEIAIVLFGGVDNFTDQLPPLGLLGDFPGETYDSVGRYFYLGLTFDL